MLRKIARVGEILADGIKARFDTRYKINHAGNGVVNFVDVGSVGGLPHPWLRNANRIAFLLNFEPNGEITRTENSMTYNTALWNDESPHDFYIYRGASRRRSGSSLFEQNIEYVRENFDSLSASGPPHLAESWFRRSELLETRTLECRSLDNVLADSATNLAETPFHFLKIDAQGAEYQILNGAENLLRTDCVGMELELFKVPLYKGIRLLDEVESYLAGFDFEMVHKCKPHGTFDSQHNCLFLHKTRMPEIQKVIREVYAIS